MRSVLLLVTLASVGCSHFERDHAGLETVATEVPAPAPVSPAAAADFENEKSVYIKAVSTAIRDLEMQIASYREQAPRAPDEREYYMNVVASLESNLADTKAKRDATKLVSKTDWDQAQRDVEQSLLATTAAVDAALQRTAH